MTAARKIARAIPVDKASIKELAKDLEQHLAKALTGREGPVGQEIFGQYPFEIRAVDGTPRKLWVRLQAIPSRDFRYYVSGALGTVRGKPVVVVNVNGSLDAQVIWKGTHARTTHSMLYPILLHELTHAADIFGPGLGGMSEDDAHGNAAYYNHPSELRAYMQEVVDEVEQRFTHYAKMKARFGNRALDMLLNMSTTWTNVSPHWTAASRRKVLKAVYQALQTWEERQTALKVAAAYYMPARVAQRYVRARATSLAPVIRVFDKGEAPASVIEQALEALEVRRNGDRWAIDADWYYGLGPRNQTKAGQIIQFLITTLRAPEAVDPVEVRSIANMLKWLEKTKKTNTFAHGDFEISPMGVTGPAVQDVLVGLDKAAHVIRSKFAKVLYGKVYITKTLPRSHTGTVASYVSDGDVLYVSTKAKNTVGDVYAICHEFGHRYFHKFWKNAAQKAEFMRLSTETTYAETVYDKAAREKMAEEYVSIAKARRDGTPQPNPSELFLNWLSEVRGTPDGNVSQKLGVRLVKGEDVEDELRKAVLSGKDFTVKTKEVVRAPEHVTSYGKTGGWTENFAEAFAHLVLGMKMPPGIAAIMADLS
jgi:hypothetical protein